MLEQLLKFFVVFLVVVDPLSLIPVFAGLTNDGSRGFQRKMACKSALIALAICVAFALVGAKFLQVMGISLNSFRIAGGTLLFLIALEMVFGKPSGTRATKTATTTATPVAQAQPPGHMDVQTHTDAQTHTREDVSVFPLAFPFIAGPGSLAIILLAAGEASGKPLMFLGLLAVMACVVAICWIAMMATPRLMKVFGATGANVANRLSGVVLAALAVQFIVDGIRGSFLSG
jgi:multiple antibiotic resistance protein